MYTYMYSYMYMYIYPKVKIKEVNFLHTMLVTIIMVVVILYTKHNAIPSN